MKPAKPARTPGRAVRTRNPDDTKADIIQAALEEFCEHGFRAAKLENIAKRTHTRKRMIYYYFETKDELYRQVLFEYYMRQREGQSKAQLDLDDKDPITAMVSFVHFMFDYHLAHAEDVRLVMAENMYRGRHISTMRAVNRVMSSILEPVKEIIKRGVEQKVMRPDVAPFDVYMTIVSLCYYNVSNRYTVAAIWGYDLSTPIVQRERRKSITEAVLRYVAA